MALRLHVRHVPSVGRPGGRGQLPEGRDREGQSGGSRAVRARALDAHKHVGGDPTIRDGGG